MYATYVPVENLDKIIFPADKPLFAGGDLRGYSLLNKVSTGMVFHTYYHELVTIKCVEHDREEQVPSVNLRFDLRRWYDAGRHPRFSIVGALLEAKQRVAEIRSFTESQANRPVDAAIIEALKISDTKEDFIKTFRPHLFTSLRVNRRSFRVSNAFKERFDVRSFTVDEFLAEENQELRRIIVRLLPIKKIIERMSLVCTDSEGTLYDFVRPDGVLSKYLHVVCPSTAQEYLLEVPARFWDPRSQSNRTMDTPSLARRWTFNLPDNAQFAKEA